MKNYTIIIIVTLLLLLTSSFAYSENLPFGRVYQKPNGELRIMYVGRKACNPGESDIDCFIRMTDRDSLKNPDLDDATLMGVVPLSGMPDRTENRGRADERNTRDSWRWDNNQRKIVVDPNPTP